MKKFKMYPAFFSGAGILISFIMMFPAEVHPQSTENIGNVVYRFSGDKMLIFYDIIKGKPGETYEISLEILQPPGTRIIPVSVYGDVNKGVVPGRQRSITWDYEEDNVEVEEGFKIRIYGKPVIRKEALPDSILKKYEINHTLDMGIGFGLDYGGIFGVRMTFMPMRYLGIFGCAGILNDGTGWEAGAKGYFIPKSSVKIFRPYIKAMYGVNTEVFIKGTDEYNKHYLGFSAGAGTEFRFGRTKSHGINLDLNVPFRSAEYFTDLNKLRNDPNIDIQFEPGVITISFGYHIEF